VGGAHGYWLTGLSIQMCRVSQCLARWCWWDLLDCSVGRCAQLMLPGSLVYLFKCVKLYSA
jgi:hypothetical protein